MFDEIWIKIWCPLSPTGTPFAGEGTKRSAPCAKSPQKWRCQQLEGEFWRAFEYTIWSIYVCKYVYIYMYVLKIGREADPCKEVPIPLNPTTEGYPQWYVCWYDPWSENPMCPAQTPVALFLWLTAKLKVPPSAGQCLSPPMSYRDARCWWSRTGMHWTSLLW
jgi:hypothetical protein